MKARIGDLASEQAGKLRALIVEPARVDKTTPVLLFLHGKGEASEKVNGLPKVCDHLSPPLQAMFDRLSDVIVVAPQAPVDPKNAWDWETYLPTVVQFLQNNFEGHKILATGFSRGGLGVLHFIKLLRECKQFPEGVSQWAIVDPQAHPAGANGLRLSPEECATGWMRYGTQYTEIVAFGNLLYPKLGDAPECLNMKHGALARAAYHEANVLDGKHSLYKWLNVSFV